MRRNAFSLIELLVAISIASALLTATISVYSLFRKATNKDQSHSDTVQSGRVALDRLSREIRQTPDIRTIFPDNASDTSPAQPGEIEFEDGDEGNPATDLTYRHYYVTGGALTLEVRECFFVGQNIRVHWNDVDSNGNPATCQTIAGSTQVIAQNVLSMVLYGRKPLQIILTTQDLTGQTYVLRTSITSRNL